MSLQFDELDEVKGEWCMQHLAELQTVCMPAQHRQLAAQADDGVATLRSTLYLQPRASGFVHPPKNAKKAGPSVGLHTRPVALLQP